MPIDRDLRTIPGYRIVRPLGSGGGGAVYLAIQESLNREVALKLLHGYLRDELSVRRFLREARMLSRLSHPNLVRVLDFGGEDTSPFVAMELLGGGTLRERIEQFRPRPAMSADLAVRLARDLLTGLVALNETGVVHRDIKPANVFLRVDGGGVLGDFGLARLVAPEITQLTPHGNILGTVAYLPPEAYAQDFEWTHAQDMFSLGLTLHEALTGRHPTDHRPIPPGFRPPDPASLVDAEQAGLGVLVS